MKINWKICLVVFLCLVLFIVCNRDRKLQESADHDNKIRKPSEPQGVFDSVSQEIVKIVKESITQKELLEHLEFLTSERLSGRPTENSNNSITDRITITLETLITTDYLKNKCSNWSLEPAGEKQSPNQCVPPGLFTSNSSINVVFYIPGAALVKEYIIIVAHYDHLAPEGGKFYPGANDNASGVSALLELSQAFSGLYNKGIKPRRSIIFLFAGAEEAGLLGSRRYATHFPLKGEIVTAISIDMVGVPEELNSFNLFGGFMASEAPRRIPEIFAYIEKWKDVFGFHKINFPQKDWFNPQLEWFERSDHYSFWKKSPTDNRIPSFLLMAGTDQKRYHTPQDTLYDKEGKLRLDLDYLERLSEFVTILVWEIANGPKPDFKAF